MTPFGCAIKKKEIMFCGNCEESAVCDKWDKHREQLIARVDNDCSDFVNENLLRFERCPIPLHY